MIYSVVVFLTSTLVFVISIPKSANCADVIAGRRADRWRIVQTLSMVVMMVSAASVFPVLIIGGMR